MTEFAVESTPTLRLDIQMGTIEIIATDRTNVSVSVAPSNPKRSGDSATAERTRVTASSDTIEVITPRRWAVLGPGDSVDIIIKTPLGSHVDARLGYGFLRATGALGDVSIDSGSGDTTLDTTRNLTSNGGHGTLRCAAVLGNASVKLASGNARIGRIDGDAQITGSHGNIDVGRLGGSSVLKTASGSIEIGTSVDDLTATTAYGSLQVGELSNGTTHVQSAHGRIDVGVRPGVAVWLDASSKQGSVRSSLAVDDAGPSEGDKTLGLHAHTTYGDIMIHYATP
ncbi:DUF4097 domain-containing protein [Microbacterium sp. MPKO10]|uniref:DUF4097 family beta strand repeat-containing protein n=1 Tax=Microbacterium sp. MPKO10 TaxID=2989818 RepID=UPI002235C3C0|nr:DUF4097 domain-containing protein [Microbacterium sp. MPKO10]MCW4456984.1 DUF4097 domain-containing protein [Microbacterium sp. MPKO10]